MYEYAHIRCIPDEDRMYVRRTGDTPAGKSCRYCGTEVETFGNAILGPFSGPFLRRDVKHT